MAAGILTLSVAAARVAAAGREGMTNTASHHENRLKYEKSPYLLQHKDNPVDWYPWGEEAFEKARKEDKPIFLSIGYSTCHWCHVMEKESFEDPEVAKLMNETFVSIKVDREERPDIDHVYMTVCQMISGNCGWPLTILMTPDKKPFFAGTYFPKHTRFGRIGMMELIPRVRDMWRNRRDELEESAQKIASALTEVTAASGGDETLDKDTLATAYEQLRSNYDPRNGGFGKAPKFPTPHNLLFLLRYWKRTGDGKALEMVETTLDHMRRGGIYDHVGFGFHRYSTDPGWLVPHFEKMLYDQALLAIAYTEAYLATGNTSYKRTAREVLDYVLRDMTSAEGGFYSAEDADSEGEEGKFYVWTQRELEEALGKDDAAFASTVFGTGKEGNFTDHATGKTGLNVLHLTSPPEELARRLGMDPDDFDERLEAVRRRLFEARQKRVRPLKDDKILTDWNGLMISALAVYYQATEEKPYLEAARKSAAFILDKMVDPEGRLLHRYRGGEAGIEAKATDYAFFIMGLIDLYEASLDISYLKHALQLNEQFVRYFWDDEEGGFFYTPSYGEKLLVRPKEVYDGALPSANSVALYNLLRLERLTADPRLGDLASRLTAAFSGVVGRYPAGHTQFLVGLDFAIGPSYEVVVTGRAGADDTRAMLRALRSLFVPNMVLVFKPDGEGGNEVSEVAKFTATHQTLDGKATAYVCRNFVCKLPTTDPEVMLEALRQQG